MISRGLTNPPMHLIVAHAGASSPAGNGGATVPPALPNLAALLQRLVSAARDGTVKADESDADDTTLTPPHERALAREFGWSGADGCLPFAARAAVADGIDTGNAPWGLVTPAHWHLARDHVALVAPDLLALGDDESRTLFDAVRELFDGEGWRFAYGAPLRWHASHEVLRDLPTASLDRAIGRSVDAWTTPAGRDDPRAKRIRRLQNEVQMRLHEHPVNEAREARGALPVNSFWLSGCGVRQPERPAPDLKLIDTLRAPALAGDGVAWAEAWRALDAGPLAALLHAAKQGAPAVLTLCGEHAARRFETRPQPFWTRLARGLAARPDPAAVLGAL